ncbi:NHL domain-containing protein [Aureliella helgolandensis]|uniref:Serine/threonine-protein kinase PknD n=1 Tax=Aureliella helgolandensis TaxID=2527968 RepID=A0A518GFV8_9BACT|nr:hypothetical protein [Aureliella helgolandensis]QDV27460.1 Serine/threonine-protein kinase PknD [Aureliella helgolandensis]
MRRMALVLGLAVFISGVCCVSAQAQFRRIRTVAGNGETGAPQAKGRAQEMPLSNPFGIQPDGADGFIIASFDQHVLYRLEPSFVRLEWIAGTGKAELRGMPGDMANQIGFNQPHEIQVDPAGNIYVADTFNHRVGMLEKATGRWKPIAGTGAQGFSGDMGNAVKASLDQAYSIAIDGHELFIADLGNHRIRRVDLESGLITTICGTGEKAMPTDGGVAKQQPLAGPRSLAIDSLNLWIVLREGNSVWRLERQSGKIFHVAGTGAKGFTGDGGPAKEAKLNGPKGIAVDPGRTVYIVDTENHAIRTVALASGKIETLVGSPQGEPGFNGDGGELTTRQLRRPHGVCLLNNGDLLIGDSENHRVRLLEQ